jgi:hypothetical protein
MFRATAVEHGRVIGTWQRKVLTKRVVLTVTPFGAVRAATRRAFEGPAEAYGTYLGRQVELQWAEGPP